MNETNTERLQEILQGHFSCYRNNEVPNVAEPVTWLDKGLTLLERAGIVSPVGVLVRPRSEAVSQITYNGSLKAVVHYNAFTGLSLHISKGSIVEGTVLLGGIEEAIAKKVFPSVGLVHVVFKGGRDFMRNAEENGFFGYQQCTANAYSRQSKPSGKARDYAVAEERVLIQHTSP